jgi:hypothetical protein
MRADPVTDFVPIDEIDGFLSDINDVVEDVADKMPDHGEFVRRLPPHTAAAASAHPTVNFSLKYERGGG